MLTLLWLLLLGPPLLVLVLLAVPVRLQFDVERDPTLDGSVVVGWLFGLVRHRWRVAPAASQEAPATAATPPWSQREDEGDTEPERKREREQPARTTPSSRSIARMLRRADFRRRLIRLVSDLLATGRPEGLAVRVRFGLDDPADTGRLWGLLAPWLVALPWRGRWPVELAVEPDFRGESLGLHTQGRLTLVPLQWLWLVGAFALSPVTLRAWHAARRDG